MESAVLAYSVKSSYTLSMFSLYILFPELSCNTWRVAHTRFCSSYYNFQAWLTVNRAQFWFAFEMNTVLKKENTLQGRWMRRQNVCIFTYQSVMAYLNKHVQHRLGKHNKNAYQIENVKDSCRNYWGFISGEQPFLRCQSKFQNRLWIHFKRPYNNLQANKSVLLHGHPSYSCSWIYSNTLIRTRANLCVYTNIFETICVYFLHIIDVCFGNC